MTRLWFKLATVALGAGTVAIAATLTHARPASAQAFVTCSSSDYDRTSCTMDTSQGVRLVKQLSRSSCKGNWGYGNGFVWVQEGCRAKFAPAGQNRPPQHHRPHTPNHSSQGLVECASSDYKRTSCTMDTSQGVRLVEQLSRSSCAGNWGYGNGFVWVQKGCRAQFAPVGTAPHHPGTAPPTNPGQGIVTCASSDYERTSCAMDTNQGVRILKTLSQSTCQGNWGYGNGFVWVQNGCRAEFGPIGYGNVDSLPVTSGPPILGRPQLANLRIRSALLSEAGSGRKIRDLNAGEELFVYWNTRRETPRGEYVYVRTPTGDAAGWMRVRGISR